MCAVMDLHHCVFLACGLVCGLYARSSSRCGGMFVGPHTLVQISTSGEPDSFNDPFNKRQSLDADAVGNVDEWKGVVREVLGHPRGFFVDLLLSCEGFVSSMLC